MPHTSVGLCWLILTCAAWVQVGEATMAHANPPQSQPEQKPPPGLGAMLEQMKAEADKVIRLVAAGSAPVEQRRRAGIFEVFAAMRPRFGPANAQLFNEREKKLVELARALGVADTMTPDVDGHRLDRYFDALERAAESIRSKGLRVEVLPVASSTIDWAPLQPGRMLRAIDPTRTLPEYIPYAELRPDPPAPKNVPPRMTFYLFPPARMTATQAQVTREQPGDFMGAIPGACIFTLQAPQSGDTDDGKTATAVMESLFPGAQAVAQAKAAAALGAQSAEQIRGVLRITADAPPPSTLSPAGLPGDVEAVLWSVARGSEIEHTILPARW